MRCKLYRLFLFLSFLLTGCVPPQVPAPFPTRSPLPLPPTRAAVEPVATVGLVAESESESAKLYSDFFEEAFRTQLDFDPERLSELGLGDGESRRVLNNPSPETEARYHQLLLEQREKLLALPPEREDQVALSRALFLWRLEDEIERYRFRYHRYPVNPIFGPQNDLLETLRDRHPIEEIDDARNYLARLAYFETKIDGQVRWLEAQRAGGIATPSFAIDQTLAQIRRFLAQSPERNPIFDDFKEKVGQLDVASDMRARLLEECILLLRDGVYPAYRRLGDTLVDLPRLEDDRPGLVYQPDGEEAYGYWLSHHTTTHLSADEIHQIGLDEVERIQAEMDALLDELGIPDGPLAMRMGQVAQQSGTLTGSNRISDEYRRLIDEALTTVTPLFARLPDSPLQITPVLAPGAPGGYYVGPAADGSRPGTFYVNLAGNRVFRYAVPTLAYHEGVPGHHFQIALQQELDHLPSFRRFTFNTAYVEGWALYAERLAWEVGLYQDDPLGNLGRLQGELFRAARLVVDTGIHHRGWSRTEANEYMDGAVGYPPGALRSEVDRYILWPGQATAYKIGMRTILNLRQEAQQDLGSDFDLAEFHRALLEEGSMPLEILSQEMKKLE